MYYKMRAEDAEERNFGKQETRTIFLLLQMGLHIQLLNSINFFFPVAIKTLAVYYII